MILMEEIRRSPVDMVNTRKYHMIYRVLYIPGGAGFLPSTVDLFLAGFHTGIGLVIVADLTLDALLFVSGSCPKSTF